jgi:hypothetical protein
LFILLTGNLFLYRSYIGKTFSKIGPKLFKFGENVFPQKCFFGEIFIYEKRFLKKNHRIMDLYRFYIGFVKDNFSCEGF